MSPADASTKELELCKVELSDLIVQVLRQHPVLCYFQGYHDIAQVFLLVLGAKAAAPALAHVSLLRIRDFLLPSLAPSLAHLQLLPAILFAVDPKLNQHLSATRPYFALAPTLTLYAHEIQEYSDIARLFDFLLAQPAVMSIYLFAVIILGRKEELLEIPADETDVLHVVLSKLPKPLDLDDLIMQAVQLYKQHPPETLPWLSWWRVSSYSVLKTTISSPARQTLDDGEALFLKHAAQLQREERRKAILAQAWQLRRPGGVGLAILIGVLAIWLRKDGTEGLSWLKFWRLWRS